MRVRTPCSADWNTMVGDDLRRFCAACGRHVTNVDALDDAAFAALLAEGGACVRGRSGVDGALLRAAVLIGASALAAAASPGALLDRGAEAPSPPPASDVNVQGLVAIGYL